MALSVIRDTAISYVVQLALDKLFSCLQNGIESVLGVEDEVEKIKGSLTKIQAVIEDAETRLWKVQALVKWLEKLKDAAYDAEDILDDFATQDLTRAAESQISRGVRDLVTNKVRRLLNHHGNMALKLKEVRKRLEAIEEESHKFHLSERVVKWQREFQEQRQTHSSVIETEVFGRDEDRDKIVNLLLLMEDDDTVSVIPIVGLGGLGKTTLAQFVFNDERIQNHFGPKMWICVSDDFDVIRLANKIIERATTASNPNLSDLEEVQRRIRKALSGRKFLLVLDDVWNEEPEKWNRLRVLLLACGGGRGSRIVVTTRSRIVASIMSSIEPHHLKGLSEEDCWSLFSRRAFRNQGEEDDYPNLVAIGRKIVNKCKGVPLAVKTLGGHLCFKREEAEWAFVRDSEMWNVADEENVHEILPALRLSYSNLKPPHLKQCFAFCAIFPKDEEIEKEKLIQLWMANGFVPSKGDMELEDIGDEIFNELVMRSFFQDVVVDKEYRTTFKMHDLVHDLAQSVAQSECCYVEMGKSDHISKRVRHLSFKVLSFDATPPAGLSEAQMLRTFVDLSFCRSALNEFATFKRLRALDLKRSNIGAEALLSSVGSFTHLRYLDLSYCFNIKTLPESMSSLRNLQTLKLARCHLFREFSSIDSLTHLRYLDLSHTAIEALPGSMSSLQNLRTLKLFQCRSFREFPSIDSLTHLRYLDLSYTDIEALPESISSFRNLRNLKLRGCHRLLQLPKGTSNMTKLRRLDITDCGSLSHMPAKIGQISCLQVLPRFIVGSNTSVCGGGLGELQCLNNLLGDLTIENLQYVTVSSDAQRANLIEKPNLRFLHLRWREDGVSSQAMRVDDTEDEVLRGLKPHQNLEALSISNYWGTHFPSWMMGSSLPKVVEMNLYGCRRCNLLPPLGELPLLKVLRIEGMDAVEYIGNEMTEGFPSLKTLYIKDMPNLKEWSRLEGRRAFPNLTMLNINKCSKLTSMPCFPSLKTLFLSETDSMLLRSVAKSTSISSLDMEGYSELTSLPEGMLQNLTSLESLSILSFEKLTSLREDEMQGLTHLQHLTIDRCHELVYLPEGIGNLTSLLYLSIFNSPNMTSLPEGIGNLTSLQRLSIRNCTNMTYLPEGIGNLTSLQHLAILNCPNMTFLREGIGNLTSLQHLDIDMPFLPEGIGNLTSLKQLTIFNCPNMTFLPEGIENLTSLQHLSIFNCPNMTCLPAALQCLTALRRLEIKGCPELKRRCEIETGQDRHIIQHIRYVLIT